VRLVLGARRCEYGRGPGISGCGWLSLQIRLSLAVAAGSSVCVRGDTVGGALSPPGPPQALSARNKDTVVRDGAGN
jgi:hypothetical protein